MRAGAAPVSPASAATVLEVKLVDAVAGGLLRTALMMVRSLRATATKACIWAT
jgi:hypothetical protein